MPAVADTIRILTLNLYGRNGGWERRRSVLRDGLARLDPDIVCFQEAVRGPDYDQVVDLLGDGFRLVDHPGRAGDGEGATLASRWEVATVGVLALQVTDRVTLPYCGAVAVEVETPDAGTVLFVHYKPSWQWRHEHEREQQAVLAAAFIEDAVGQRPLPALVAGDFDAAPQASSVRFWTGRQSLQGISVCYLDAWEALHGREPHDAGHTFSPRNPLVREGAMPLERGRRIDYVLVRCDDHGPTLEVVGCERAFAEPVGGVWASDHFGVVADVRPARSSTAT